MREEEIRTNRWRESEHVCERVERVRDKKKWREPERKGKREERA